MAIEFDVERILKIGKLTFVKCSRSNIPCKNWPYTTSRFREKIFDFSHFKMALNYVIVGISKFQKLTFSSNSVRNHLSKNQLDPMARF